MVNHRCRLAFFSGRQLHLRVREVLGGLTAPTSPLASVVAAGGPPVQSSRNDTKDREPGGDSRTRIGANN